MFIFQKLCYSCYRKLRKDLNKVNRKKTLTMIILDHSVSIFMMKQDNEGHDLTTLNNKAKKLLTQVFGGLTITEATGTWDDGYRLYKDDSCIYTCNYSGKLNTAEVITIMKIIKDELTKGKQEAVSVMFNGTLYILDAGDLDSFKKIIAKR